jgi:UDP-N-acetyl-2-amino-2-deoxyglucuronate dehydrogenase
MSTMVGVGIIGAGTIFHRHAEAYAQLADRVRLVAVVELDESKLRQATTDYAVPFACRDYRQMLERKDVALVTVCTPPCSHEQIVIDALEAGKYVVCEKPLAHTLASADRIRKAAARFPGKLSTTFQYRYLPEVQRTVWLRDNQRLGRLLFGRFSWCSRFQKRGLARMDWWGRWEVAGGGVVMTQLIHEVDLMCHIFGPPTEVSAVVDTLNEPIESEDVCVATVRFRNGAIACCYSTISAQRFAYGYDVFGALASVHHPWALECKDKPWRRQALDDVLAVYPLTGDEVSNPHTPYVAAVLDAIEAGNPLPIGPDDAAASLEVCAGIYAAALLGRPVSLPLDRANRCSQGITASEYAGHKGGRRSIASASATDVPFESMKGLDDEHE